MPMRVLHICGATRGAPWLCEIVAEQTTRGHDVCVVIAGADGALARGLELVGVRYLVLPHDPFAHADPRAAWRAQPRRRWTAGHCLRHRWGNAGVLPQTPPGALPLDPTKGHSPLETAPLGGIREGPTRT